jgi:penicillin-binding protein 1C
MRRHLRWLVPILLCLLLIAAALALWLFHDLPSPDDLSALAAAPSSKIYDRHGHLLYEMPAPFTGSHTPVALDQIPEPLRWATLALEDASFYHNPGYDLRGILRALWYNLTAADGGALDRQLMGGSTITQQLARNLLLPGERYEQTLRRKLRELALAVRITRCYTKDEILALYLNESYYGNMAYGVEAAARAYYGKHVWDLSLAECAMLAILPNAPALWNPLEHMAEAKLRQALALDRMVSEGYIPAAAAELAKAEALSFAAAPFPIRAPHFVMFVRGQLERVLGRERLEAGGLEIHTTLDIDLNETARDMMRHRLALAARCNHTEPCPPGGFNIRNAALVAMTPDTGEVLAMVGSPDYFSARINGAVNGTTALRQPGSAIKPITYAAAFATADLTPATVMLDVRTAFVTAEGTPYVPLNYDLVFHGPVRLREALASSYNVVAVKVLEHVGVGPMIEMAASLGITTFDTVSRGPGSEPLGLALTLGGGEVRLFELTAAYAAFANGGYGVTPQVIRSVVDVEGTELWSRPCDSAETCLRRRVLDARVAYQITDILSDDRARIPTFGEDSVLNLTRPAAVKTGTTTDFRDNWTVGYTPDLVVGVWVGNADNEVMRGTTGVTGAAPLWRDIIEIAHRGRPVHDFARPEGLIEVEVCALSGQRVGPDCPHAVTELFIPGDEPIMTCDMHRRVGDRVYLALPPEAHAWARRQGLPLLPLDEAVAPIRSPELILISPDAGAVYQIDPATPRARQRIRVAAAADRPLTQVTILVNGVALAAFSAPPYEAFWQLEAGSHRFEAVAHDANGAELYSDTVEIQVRP